MGVDEAFREVVAQTGPGTFVLILPQCGKFCCGSVPDMLCRLPDQPWPVSIWHEALPNSSASTERSFRCLVFLVMKTTAGWQGHFPA